MSRKKSNTCLDLLAIEGHARQLGYHCIAGIDEAGRGPLAGPVVAAACVIPQGVVVEGINDSKKLSSAERDNLYAKLLAVKDIDYALGIVDQETIDLLNILQATFQAMRQALMGLKRAPDYILVDGLHLPVADIPGMAVVGGDGKAQSIAAASIFAKVTRDRLMQELHQCWPQYGFNVHKGYATAGHLEALQKHGPCPIHRKSFEPIRSLFTARQLEFNL